MFAKLKKGKKEERRKSKLDISMICFHERNDQKSKELINMQLTLTCNLLNGPLMINKENPGNTSFVNIKERKFKKRKK